MGTTVSHPLASSQRESLLDRINRTAMLLGLLGPLGFLEYLTGIHPVFELASLFYIFFLGFLVPPATIILREVVRGLDSLRRAVVGGDSDGETGSSAAEDDPTAWITSGYEPGMLKNLQMVALIVHPNVVIRGIPQIGGSIVAYVRHAGRLPSPETFASAVDYRPPFDGEWTVVNGSPDKRYSHSWIPARQRYAYDFVMTDEEGRTNDESGGLDSFYCFDEPILSPAAGTVVRAKDGHRDHHRTSGWVDPLQYRLAGNYVVIKHADGEYSFLAHLKEGSICVESGDRVERGQEIGRCGHSGNSTEPHLHFHLQDHAIPYIGAGLPVQFEAITDHPELSRSERAKTYVHSGQTVRYGESSD